MKISAFARLLASVTALSLAAPALAQDSGGQSSGSVNEFELPTERPTPRGEAQGPVVEGIAPPRPATPVPTATPAPSPRPSASAAPVRVDPGSSTPRPQATADPVRSAIDNFGAARTQATPTPTPSATATSAADLAEDADVVAAPLPTAEPLPLPTQLADEVASPVEAVPAQADNSNAGITWWLWALGVLAVGALGTAVGWILRDRKSRPLMIEAAPQPKTPDHLPVEPVSPPAELPKVSPRPAQPTPRPTFTPPPPPPPQPAEEDEEFGSDRALRIALEPARLSVSLLNATLSYRILLTNQGEQTLNNITIDGDMVSAHASLSQEDQVAGEHSPLESRHLIRALAPGQTIVVSGDFTLPLPMIRPIRKGDAALFVPLARLRVVAGEGEQSEVVVQTSVVGQRSPNPGGGIQPFRLDLGPRIYSELAQRAFA